MNRECYTCPVADEGVICGKKSSRHCKQHLAKYAGERTAIMARIRVRTEHVYPPIPVREWDWSAVDDKTYDGPGNPIGWGRTEQAAIDDLINQIQDSI